MSKPMIVDVPLYDDDGNVKFTLTATPEQQQVLLQFALNFLVSAGLHTNYGIVISQEEQIQTND